MSVSSGWGRFTWGQANWNENQKFGAGWGAKTWGEESWGDLNDVTISVTGQEITSSMGIEGWGNNAYGRGAWGEFAATVGLGADVSVSGVSFSAATTAASGIGSAVVDPSGVSSSSSVGSLTVEPLHCDWSQVSRPHPEDTDMVGLLC